MEIKKKKKEKENGKTKINETKKKDETKTQTLGCMIILGLTEKKREFSFHFISFHSSFLLAAVQVSLTHSLTHFIHSFTHHSLTYGRVALFLFFLFFFVGAPSIT